MRTRARAASVVRGVRIAGVGSYAPERILSNEDLAQLVNTNDEWITSRTGMKRRHIAAADQATSDLAIEAGRRALARAGLSACEIDAFVVATVTPDYPFPATACLVANGLGAPGKAAFDIGIACSGFVYGLTVASGLVRSGVFRRVMLIGAEALSKITNYTDRSTCVLFGDGAGAVILEASEQNCFLGTSLGADGSKPEVLFQPAGGSRMPASTQTIEENLHSIHMSGKEVFKFAVSKMVDSALTALGEASLSPDDMTYLIPHQANLRIIDSVTKYLKVPAEKVVVNIQEYGNTSSASIPLALAELDASGKLKEGDVIVFVAFGGGLSWGAVAWRWAA
ncbi:ketoacyl-ACP synthase III [bacterium]|nr:MAG: ketoacyl-ACP synthase III [bacterium]